MRNAIRWIAVTALLIGSICHNLNGVEIWEFTGSYCPACREMEPIVARLADEGIPIRRIDVRIQPEIARSLGIHSIPCFVAMVGERPVDRIQGVTTREELLQMVRRADPQGLAAIQRPASLPIVRGQSQEEPTRPPALPSVDLIRPLWPSKSPREATATDLAHEARNSRPSHEPQAVDPVHRALTATVRLKVIDDRGQSFGTGTVIDRHEQEYLVLTCGHIFRDSAGKGDIRCEVFLDGHPQEATGTVVSYDLRRDVGLVCFCSDVKLQPVRIGGNGHRPREGDNVFAIGCSHGATPSVIKNRILAVNRYHGPANFVVGGRPVDGRSGGGLFDAEGTLIGVCNAADQEQDEGLYAALGPVHAELDTAGLSFIYRDQEPSVASLDKKSSQSTPRPPVQHAQPARFSDIAQASGPEVIVIIRQRGQDHSNGEAYVLDHPSDRLLDALSGELARRGEHQLTEMFAPRQAPVATSRNDNPDGWPKLR